MYFIIAGHISPLGHEYIYVFSVPLFFVISGFLCKYENNNKIFWVKLYRNLFLPCIIICTLCSCYDLLTLYRLGSFQWFYIPQRILNCVLGMQGRDSDAGGLGLCWFIYTLIVCKILYQYTFKSMPVQIFVLICCFITAYLIKYLNYNIYNALINTDLAFPYFVLGRGFRVFHDRYGFSINRKILLCLLIGGLLLIIMIKILNGTPWMFKSIYGNDLLLFYIGGISGTMAVYSISILLPTTKVSYLFILNKGLILILGFQWYALKFYYILPDSCRNVFTDYLTALLILLAFIPIIKLTEKFFPIILGDRVSIS